jgi:hypothetical protein
MHVLLISTVRCFECRLGDPVILMYSESFSRIYRYAICRFLDRADGDEDDLQLEIETLGPPDTDHCGVTGKPLLGVTAINDTEMSLREMLRFAEETLRDEEIIARLERELLRSQRRFVRK